MTTLLEARAFTNWLFNRGYKPLRFKVKTRSPLGDRFRDKDGVCLIAGCPVVFV